MKKMGAVEKRKKLLLAAKLYFDRQMGLAQPSGKFDRLGRFYLNNCERLECCHGIRHPSVNYPIPQMEHSRTTVHIAAMFDVERIELLRLVKTLTEFRALAEED